MPKLTKKKKGATAAGKGGGGWWDRAFNSNAASSGGVGAANFVDVLSERDRSTKTVFDNDKIVRVFVAYNAIFAVLGLTLLIVGLQLLVEADRSGASSLVSLIYTSTIIVGACMIGHATLGVAGAVFKYIAMLKIYFVVLYVLLVLTTVSAGFGFIVKDDAEAYYSSNWDQLRELYPKGTTLAEAMAYFDAHLTAVCAGAIICVIALFIGLIGSALLIKPHHAGSIVVGMTNFFVLPVSVSLLVWGGYLLAFALQTPFVIKVVNGCIGLAVCSTFLNVIGSLGVVTRAKTIMFFFIAMLCVTEIGLIIVSSSLLGESREWANYFRTNWFEFYRTPSLHSYLNLSPEEFHTRIDAEVREFGFLFLVMVFVDILQICGALAVIRYVYIDVKGRRSMSSNRDGNGTRRGASGKAGIWDDHAHFTSSPLGDAGVRKDHYDFGDLEQDRYDGGRLGASEGEDKAKKRAFTGEIK